jgi:hypothetical protein
MSDKPPRTHKRSVRRSSPRPLRVVHLILVLAEQDAAGSSFGDLLNHPRLIAYYGTRPDPAHQMLREDLALLAGRPLRSLRRLTRPADDALIRIDPHTQRYHLARPIPALALDPSALEALRTVLNALLDGKVVPGGRELVERILSVLSAENRAALATAPAIDLDLRLAAMEPASESIAMQLLRARRERRTIAYHYQPPYQAIPTRHHGDEVLGLWIGAHPYATVWCADHGVELDLRLERFVPGTLELLPKLANPRARQGVPIRYWLAPRLAESGDTQHLDQQHATPQPDGSVEVSGIARNLFWAQKLLLGYGEHARALAPPALVALMQRRIAAMAARYDETAPPEGGADGKDGVIP